MYSNQFPPRLPAGVRSCATRSRESLYFGRGHLANDLVHSGFKDFIAAGTNSGNGGMRLDIEVNSDAIAQTTTLQKEPA